MSINNTAFVTLYGAAILALPALIWWGPTLKADEWAAWVQAFGSIGAIIGAVWIAADDRRQQARQADVASLNVTAVVLEQGYWLARRTIIKLPVEPVRLNAASASWARVSQQWFETISQIRKLPPLIPQQFNAQLVATARLDRAVGLYESSLAEYLDMDELLDLDKATGRVFREIELLDDAFTAKGAAGPIAHLRQDLPFLKLQVEAVLARNGARLVVDDSRSFITNNEVIEPANEFFSRRLASINALAPATGDLAKNLLTEVKALGDYVQASLLDPAFNQTDREEWICISDRIDVVCQEILMINTPHDPGG